jgi:hypothetical protein
MAGLIHWVLLLYCFNTEFFTLSKDRIIIMMYNYVTNQNLIQEEIQRRLNSGNACYHSVQNLLSSRLLSKNLKIRIYKTITLPAVLFCMVVKLGL